MSRQMIGNEVVNALSQVLVGRLESNGRDAGRVGFYRSLFTPRPPPALLCRLSRSRSLSANPACGTGRARPALAPRPTPAPCGPGPVLPEPRDRPEPPLPPARTLVSTSAKQSRRNWSKSPWLLRWLTIMETSSGSAAPPPAPAPVPGSGGGC